jgi:putative transposase
MCRVLMVSSSGYYAWCRRPESKLELENKALLIEIRVIHSDRHMRCYGSPMMYRELLKRGYSCSENRVARLMKKHGIKAVTANKFKITTDSNHQKPVAPNILARDFESTTPNQKWGGDISYVWTKEGWLYLAVILDLFSRRVISWSLLPRMTEELACNTLRKAIANRLPIGLNLLAHSDRGSQYSSKSYQGILKAFNITCSMSRKGNCWDNAVLESFFASIKNECIYLQQIETRAQAHSLIFDYIERFYNQLRLHSSLGYLSPAEFEQQYYDKIKKIA